MTRRQLTVALLPVAALVLLAIVALGVAWKIGSDLDFRKGKLPAAEETARIIDAKANISTESGGSATAMAKALEAGDKAQRGFVQFLHSLGMLMLIVAAVQAFTIVRLRLGREPSNSTVETDARKIGARGSL